MYDIRTITAAALAVAAGALLAACEEDAAAKQSLLDRAIPAWKQAGLEVPEFAPMAGAGIGGGKCRTAMVQKLETVVCEFPDDDAARSARGAGLTYVGETTGVVLPAGEALLVVVDRAKADPAGKTINAIAVAFLDSAAAGKPAADKPADKAADKPGEAADKADPAAAKPAEPTQKPAEQGGAKPK